MGRARRQYRGRHTAGWRAPRAIPRFAVGADVQCLYRGEWVCGRVIAHHYEEPAGVFHPYQVRLEGGQWIYAPEDTDECIQAVFRFRVGADVLCNIGLLTHPTWAKGRVVALHYEEPPGCFHPYQVRLECGQLIFAPQDTDIIIRASKRKTGGDSCATLAREDAVTRGVTSGDGDKSQQPAAAQSEEPSLADEESHGHRALMKDILAAWLVATRSAKDEVVDLACDDADTDFKCLDPCAEHETHRDSREHLGQQDVRDAQCASRTRGHWLEGRPRGWSRV